MASRHPQYYRQSRTASVRASRRVSARASRTPTARANSVSKLKQLVQAIEADVQWATAKLRVLDDQDGIDASDVAHYFARQLEKRVKQLKQF